MWIMTDTSLVNIQCAHDELVDVDLLIPNPRNPNNHPERQIKMLSKIIGHQGQRAPIVVSNQSGFIVKGHGRLMAIKALGWAQAAVDYQDYKTPADEYADMIADNKIAELAEHDDATMIKDLIEFPDMDLELLGIPDLNLEPIEMEVEKEPEQKDLKITECPECGHQWSKG
jgi:ParB-like chromosome segregation protein Spo0J